MKTITLPFFVFFILLISIKAHSQVKIGGNIQSINANSLLELESNTKGLLLPRLTSAQIKAMSNVPAGMFVFNSTDSALYLRRDTGWAVLALRTDITPHNEWATLDGNIYSTGNSSVGIGTPAPLAKLDVAGVVRATGITIPGFSSLNNFIISNPTGNFTTRKGFGGVGFNYIICMNGIYPTRDGGGGTSTPFLGEIDLFAGNFAPSGWALCDGSLLPINQFQAMFSILGTTYGGNGTTNFALPDLRSAAPVGVGELWQLGEKN